MRNPNRNPTFEQSSSSSSLLTNNTPSDRTDGTDDNRIFLSPGFKSVAAMAGWDEEAILLATLIVEDTPERRSGAGSKQEKKKRADFQFKTPPTNSRRKRKSQRRSPASIPAVVLDLDEEGDTSNRETVLEKEAETNNKIESEQQERAQLNLEEQRFSASTSSSSPSSTTVSRPDADKKELKTNENIGAEKQERDDEQRSSVPSSSSFAATSQAVLYENEKEIKTDKIDLKKKDRKEEERDDNELVGQRKSAPCPSISSNLPDMDKLREELSCAICLEICFEPSTTPCGHSFCKKCLRSAADKCGKRCPKCRQLISNGRSCTVNTVLWNTIQLLFPSEIEVRRAAASEEKKKREMDHQKKSTERTTEASGRERRLSLSIQHRRNHRSHLPQRAPSSSSGRDYSVVVIPSQNEDAAYALRLQREEFLRAYGSSSSTTTTTRDGVSGGSGRSNALAARANLRAMATRAISLRSRNPSG